MPQNIAEIRIIGRVSKIETTDKVTHINVASNYNRQRDGQWEQDTHWNRVSAFGKTAEHAGKAHKGDLVHITGRVRQGSYEKNGETIYTVELIADSFSVLAKAGEAANEDHQD